MTWIIIIALLLRLVLFGQSLWLDESIEALALMGKMGPLLNYALADFQPPLYHLIGYVTTQLLGYSEIVLRLPSLISGLFTVYFVVKIGESVASRKVGLIAGLLAATNPLIIYYSQEGRTYAMTTFFVTASFYYFLELLKQKNLKLYLLYSLFTVLFIWTSYLSWFVLLAQGLYVIWKKRYDLLIIQVIATFTLLAWLPSMLTSLSIGRSTISNSPAWGNVVGGLSFKSLPLTWVKFVIGRISFDHKIVYATVVSAIGLFHLYILKRVNFKQDHLLALWIIPPIILGLFTASILPVYSYFRVLFVLPAYLVLLSLGLSKIPNWRPLTALVIVIQLCALGYFWITPRFHKEDWRSLVQNLPEDAVVAMPSRAQSAPLIYYGVGDNLIEPSKDQLLGSPIYYVRYVEDLFDGTGLGRANFSSSGYTITNQKVYPGIQMDIYENRN